MTTTFLFANNASTVLTEPVTANYTELDVTAGTGSLFPNPIADQQFAVTVQDKATGLITEIMYCTAVVGDVFTVIRGQEGTTAKPWKVGDIVNNWFTAGTANNFAQDGVYIVSALPSAIDSKGIRALVTDSDVDATGSFGAIVATGGAFIVPVWCDGTNWRIG